MARAHARAISDLSHQTLFACAVAEARDTGRACLRAIRLDPAGLATACVDARTSSSTVGVGHTLRHWAPVRSADSMVTELTRTAHRVVHTARHAVPVDAVPRRAVGAEQALSTARCVVRAVSGRAHLSVRAVCFVGTDELALSRDAQATESTLVVEDTGFVQPRGPTHTLSIRTDLADEAVRVRRAVVRVAEAANASLTRRTLTVVCTRDRFHHWGRGDTDAVDALLTQRTFTASRALHSVLYTRPVDAQESSVAVRVHDTVSDDVDDTSPSNTSLTTRTTCTTRRVRDADFVDAELAACARSATRLDGDLDTSAAFTGVSHRTRYVRSTNIGQTDRVGRTAAAAWAVPIARASRRGRLVSRLTTVVVGVAEEVSRAVGVPVAVGRHTHACFTELAGTAVDVTRAGHDCLLLDTASPSVTDISRCALRVGRAARRVWRDADVAFTKAIAAIGVDVALPVPGIGAVAHAVILVEREHTATGNSTERQEYQCEQDVVGA